MFYACVCVGVFMSVSDSALTFFSPQNSICFSATRSADADFNGKNCDAVNIILLLLLLLLLVNDILPFVKKRQRTPLTSLPPFVSSCFLTLSRGFNLICIISLSFYFYFSLLMYIVFSLLHPVDIIMKSDFCVFLFTPSLNLTSGLSFYHFPTQLVLFFFNVCYLRTLLIEYC